MNLRLIPTEEIRTPSEVIVKILEQTHEMPTEQRHQIAEVIERNLVKIMKGRGFLICRNDEQLRWAEVTP